MNFDIHTMLSEFSEKLKIPAVGGGVLSDDGSLDYDVVGFRHRGGHDEVKKDDQWHIGSCGKSITAVLYARLVEAGDADWDCPVASLFPDLTNKISNSWNDRTIEDLFLCQAGMQANPTSSSMLSGYVDKRSMAVQRTEAAIAAMCSPPKPRDRFLYSNLSYMVIGAAIDRITGTSFEEALEMHVLEPLGITSLGYGPPELVWGHKSRIRLGNLTLLTGEPANPHDARSDNPRMLSSAGTMHLRLTDWAKFLHLFLTRGNGFVQPETIDYLLSNPNDSRSRMAKGWAKSDGVEGVSFGMQGSNTMWVATALLNSHRTRLSFVVCNDGRTRILTESAKLAVRLLAVRSL